MSTDRIRELDSSFGKTLNARRGFTIFELTVVVTVLAIFAGLTTFYLRRAATDAKQRASDAVATEIEVQAERYRALTGNWPSTDLRELRHSQFFPGGVPVSPVDGSPFQLQRGTGQVIRHVYP
jgi:prepilin-type N-terminal cleavage/methylation domain-containing protein